jgi:hypothetical protein
MLIMSCLSFNARLDTSHHGPPHPYKDAGAVADSLTGIHSAMVKCLSVVNRSCIDKGVQVFPQVKIQRIQICAWSVEAMQWVLLYLSVGHDRCY